MGELSRRVKGVEEWSGECVGSEVSDCSGKLHVHVHGSWVCPLSYCAGIPGGIVCVTLVDRLKGDQVRSIAVLYCFHELM